MTYRKTEKFQKQLENFLLEINPIRNRVRKMGKDEKGLNHNYNVRRAKLYEMTCEKDLDIIPDILP